MKKFHSFFTLILAVASANSFGQIIQTANASSASSCDGTASADIATTFLPNAWKQYVGGQLLPFAENTFSVQDLCPNTYYLYWYTTSSGDTTSLAFYVPQDVVAPCSGYDITINSTNSTIGQCNGSASVVATGGQPPYTYVWSNNESTSSVSGLCPGSYTCTITDDDGCIENESVYISSFDPCSSLTFSTFTLTAVPLEANCSGLGFVSGIGGTPPYSYLWSNGETTEMVNNLCNGFNSCTITDNAGCQETFSGVTYIPNIYLTISDASSSSSCDGSVYIDSSLTIFPNSWNISSPSGIQTIENTYSLENLCPGNYSMYCTMQNGDTAWWGFQIGVHDPICDNFGAVMLTTPTIDNAFTGSASIFVYGSPGGSNTYIWNTNFYGSVQSNLPQGYYYCDVYNNLGCQTTVVGNIGVLNGIPPLAVDTFIVFLNNNLPPSPAPIDSIQVQIYEDCNIDPDLIGSAAITAMQNTPIGSAITWTVYALDGSVLGTYQFDYNVPLNPGAFYYSTFILYCDGRNNGTFALTVHDYFEFNSTASVSTVSNLEIKVVNPFSDQLQVTFSETVEGSIQLIDASGKIIFSDVVNGIDYKKSTSNLSSGIYFLELTVDGQIEQFKLVK